MRSVISYSLIVLGLVLNGCSKDDDSEPQENQRAYKMGFTTWSYGPTLQAVDSTYAFVNNHADIYTEHVDNKIPWNAWMNDLPLPVEFTQEINGKVNRRIPNKELLLSVSMFNANRDDLAEDVDGSIPAYTSLDDVQLKEAYFKHIDYLVNAFSPNYLVISIEVNELRLRSPEKWAGYTNLIQEVKSRIKQKYPNLPISESVSLHNFYQPDVANPQDYISDITTQMNGNDFVAISFYPFMKGLLTKSDIQKAFDFLHAQAAKPIAFVETAHLAEDLEIPNLNVSIPGDESNQNMYLETLLSNAETQNYSFVIWWAHRDFDALWQTFPPEVKDLGQIWRDTGLLDENGRERPGFFTWQTKLNS